MSPIVALRLVTYLVVADGIAALWLAGLIGLVGAGVVGAAMLSSWWLDRARERGTATALAAWALVALAAGVLALDLAYFATSLLDGMVHVLLFVILARMILGRSVRDLRDAGFLSFFLLVATASITFSVGFLVVFVVYLALATWMMILNHVVSEAERAGRRDFIATRVGVRGQMLRVSLAAAAGTFVVASLLFFVIPRVGQATMPFRAQLSRMVTGFSDRVDLGSFGDIEADKTVVMRVHLSDTSVNPLALPNLRWRGIVYDHFDGRTWSVAEPDRRPLRRAAGQFAIAPPRGRGPIVRQDVYLEPIGTDIVFAAPRVLRMEVRAGAIHVDDMGSLSVPSAAARLHYVAESELELPPPVGTRVPAAGAALEPEDRQRFLQLPAMSPSIARLARGASAGSRDPYEAASRLTAFLSSNYRYSLGKKEAQREPLEDFLFASRTGNCEYFAAALAVMLRSIGIPARVVGGFQRGEWNPYGRYFMVRLADAHAWVEAYFDGLGWVTFDPSPRAEGDPRLAAWPISLYLDAARMRWYRYVVNWSSDDQRAVVSTVQRRAQDFRFTWPWPTKIELRRWIAPSLVALLAGGAVVCLAIRTRRSRAASSAHRMPRFYERALRLLARRGLSPAPHETARQFWGRAAERLPACAEPLARITRAYERARFGGASLTEAERATVEKSLAELAQE